MKKLFLLFTTLSIGIFLFGCSDNNQVENKNEDPNINENSIEEIDIEAVNEKSASAKRPPDLSLVGVGDPNTSVSSKINSYCWNESNCTLTPKKPQDLLIDTRDYPVAPGQKLSFIVSATAYQALIFPDSLKVTQIHKDTETEIEVTNKVITVPTEKGIYYYHVNAKWEGEIKGEAYYAFFLRVK
ncbi:hypothetical protein [Fredinandcohnia quinoae]|uniref:Lipoprotein n=1 Tax=Fredinandcohnia quinoae TaxID=2918902 RepID=A0AAW5E288_9BACI|nr:hypothetical protein [Fredinandcohnia sp. SECRCQ15]MCH1626473.1 hypothetical protein [Fredinandcohnia sp. SECRCQ15]